VTAAETVFLLALLYNIGKAGAHATRGIGQVQEESMSWARTPLIEGLPISELYHGLSGVQWLLVLYACSDAWGTSIAWWAPSLACWGTIWPLSKLLKGLTLRQAIFETFYMQFIMFVWRRTHR